MECDDSLAHKHQDRQTQVMRLALCPCAGEHMGPKHSEVFRLQSTPPSGPETPQLPALRCQHLPHLAEHRVLAGIGARLWHPLPSGTPWSRHRRCLPLPPGSTWSWQRSGPESVGTGRAGQGCFSTCGYPHPPQAWTPRQCPPPCHPTYPGYGLSVRTDLFALVLPGARENSACTEARLPPALPKGAGLCSLGCWRSPPLPACAHPHPVTRMSLGLSTTHLHQCRAQPKHTHSQQVLLEPGLHRLIAGL